MLVTRVVEPFLPLLIFMFVFSGLSGDYVISLYFIQRRVPAYRYPRQSICCAQCGN